MFDADEQRYVVTISLHAPNLIFLANFIPFIYDIF